ncbi:MAG: hypothetical protein DSY86_04780 [Marinomonas sp.]|uniref:Uncharacterized protein n=1 Tax=Marinomonas communis TaxID=28254 RepID=A0A4R6X7A4_9GAMM|nr:hypothetical protein [Marinomonas communis]MCC4273164.1 hypothetical protein [Marinomonas communis]RUM49393.1 MAG: hypothetical protein DSY85_15775 [Marinomonas sp.]RUM52814.1 MAG: hypothetical protein DSY86_04780 [Marinomonas sp.]TDR12623.1 hypothetical protein C8D85_2661 [Marinomonas communis]
MIFIDTINKLTQLPEREEQTHFRRRRSKASQDSLTLSEAASHVQQINLSYEYATALTPTDSIIANMLEAVLQQLEHQHVHVEALSQFAPRDSSWQLTLQTPPLSQNDNTPSYADSAKDLKHEKQFKRIELHLLGSDGTDKPCLLTFIPHHLSAPLRQALFTLNPMQSLTTPYTSNELDSLPQHWLFEIDQDGESEPLTSLHTSAKAQTIQYNGLQIWFERQQDSLPLLISDQQLGYIYIGNYETYSAREDEPEEHVNTSGSLDLNA